MLTKLGDNFEYTETVVVRSTPSIQRCQARSCTTIIEGGDAVRIGTYLALFLSALMCKRFYLAISSILLTLTIINASLLWYYYCMHKAELISVLTAIC